MNENYEMSRDRGQMYPIIVFRNEDDEYELVAGEQRN